MRTRCDPEAQDGRSTGGARQRLPASPSRSQGLVARLLGLALGAMLAAHSIAGLEIPHGPPSLPLTISVSLIRSGEVGLVGDGRLLTEADVGSGDDTARGHVLLTSETAAAVEMSVHDVGPPIGLEDHLWLRVTVGGALVFEGAQARLRRSSSRSLRISPGATVPIDVTVGLLPGAEAHAAGRRTEIRLQVLSPAVGGSAVVSG